jgi:hypothetical protein
MIPILTPEYLRLIQVTGTAYAEYWRIPARDLLTQPWAGLGAAVIIGMRLVRPGAETRHLCQMLLLTLLILLGGAIVQQKGWAYHFYPAHACGVLLAGVLVLEAWGRPQFVTRMAGATLSVLLLLGCGIPVVKAHVQSALYWRGQPGATNTNFGQLIRLTTKHARGERIYVFSDNLTDAFPLVNYSDVGWACRFPSLWILPGVYGGQRDRPSSPAYHTLREMTQCERYLFEAVVTDLVREKPALLFVPQPPPRLAGWNFEFDYLAYFSQDPRFVTWLQGYEIISRGEHFLLYRRRKAAQAFSSPSKNRTLGGFLRTVHGDEGM